VKEGMTLMIRNVFLPIALCATLCGCSSEKSQAETVIRDQLKDPDSAEFGKFESNGKKACLQVNAKNSFGGYTGFQTAFLKKDEKGNWDGYIVPPPADYDFCLHDLNTAE
jgi:hypothetical protein